MKLVLAVKEKTILSLGKGEGRPAGYKSNPDANPLALCNTKMELFSLKVHLNFKAPLSFYQIYSLRGRPKCQQY